MVGPNFDYSDYTDGETQSDHDVKVAQRLQQMAGEFLDREVVVARLEEELAEAKSALRDVSETRLPELMEDLGSDAFTTRNGVEIKVKEYIRGSIPKDQEPEAFQHLENTGNGNIIKRQFIIDFGKDEEKWAAKFTRDLRQRKKPLNCKTKRTVHSGTLQAFVREQLKEGVDFPLKLFGVFRQRIAKVKVKT